MSHPLEPVLASTLYNALPATSKRSDIPFHKSKRRRLNPPKGQHEQFPDYLRAKTGHKKLDDYVLQGGLRYGRGGLVCLSGEKGGRAFELTLQILANHLLAHPTASAFYVDSTGSFNAARVSGVMKQQLGPRSEDASHNSKDEEVIESTVKDALARVSVTRVFDFAGLFDALSEIARDLRARDPIIFPDESRAGESGGYIVQPTMRSATEKKIPDSQSPSPPISPLHPPPTIKITTAIDTGGPNKPKITLHHQSHPRRPPVPQPLPQTQTPTLLILPSLPRHTSPQVLANNARGQALLSLLMRRLAHFTREFNMLVVIGTITVGVPPRLDEATATMAIRPPVSATNEMGRGARSVSTSGNEARDYRTAGFGGVRPQQRCENAQTQQVKASVSAFAATGASRPALGKVLSDGVDLGIILVKIKSREGGFREVVEVIKDRMEGRLGRWCVF